jgi:photosystem II stability/assembly factor-like uncharacterized protein
VPISQAMFAAQAPARSSVRQGSSGPLLWCQALILCVAVWLGATVPAGAQDITVHTRTLAGPAGPITHLTGSPDGQTLFAVAVASVHRHDDQTQWLATGHLARSDALYRSLDGGATWQPATNNLIPGSISALYLDPQTGNLYVGLLGAGDIFTRRYGLWYSRDQGLTWEQVALGRDDLYIRAIVRSADGRYLFLGAHDAGRYPSSYVYRSADDGRTWQQFQALRYEQRPGSILAELLPHPENPERLFLLTIGGDLFVSNDAGETWALAQEEGEQAEVQARGGRPAKMAVAAGQPALLLARNTQPESASLTLLRSADGGLKWQRLSTLELPTKANPSAMTALPGGVWLLSTDIGTYRSTDGGQTWQALEGPLSSGGVSEFFLPGRLPAVVLAATDYGLFISRDAGALWQPFGRGLPFNSSIAGLLTDPRYPDRILAVGHSGMARETPSLLWRSADSGHSWTPAAARLPAVSLLGWAVDPHNPDAVFLTAWEHLFRTTDGGVTWQSTGLTLGKHGALAIAPSAPNTMYLAGQPLLRSTDGGATWQEVPVRTPGQERQVADVVGLAVDRLDADHVWAALDGVGVYESTDGGTSWREAGLAGRPVQWLAAGNGAPFVLYAGVREDGIYRWEAGTNTWGAVANGLPAGSTVIAFLADPRSPDWLWAARDGGGLYLSTDRGASWSNVGAGLGDNLVQALAINYATPKGVLAGTATAGVWALEPEPAGKEPPASGVEVERVDARIEIVWPHGWAPVSEARQANIGLRLFRPGSLLPPPCTWTPEVTVWQALDTDPAEPLGQAEQRTVDGQPFPYWELNDVDVSRATDPAHKLYFMVRVAGVETATSIWVHGADARTYFPYQDVPSGVASGAIDALDTRIQVVWPHDESGAARPVAEADFVNVAVALFKHGTRLSVPPGWQPPGLTLYGAWNHEVGRPLSREATVQVRRSGAITYPVWEFDNIPVGRARHPANHLHLWVMVDGIETYPSFWTHGSDARTFFPAQDEPIQGCVP